MLINIVSWDGHSLNDSNYASWFEPGEPAGVSARASYSPRSRTYPKLSAMEIGSTSLTLHILTKGTIHSQLDTLDAWFNVYDLETKALVVADAADNNRQWYVMARPASPVHVSADGVGEYVVTLAVDEPLWRSVSAATSSLPVSTSGDEAALTVLGNWYARPKFTITINSAKAFLGYRFALWKPWYNPLSVINEEPLEFTNGGINTTNLVSDASVSNQINQGGGISESDLSIPIDTAVGGGLPTTGGMCHIDTEQIYYTGISGGVIMVYDDGAGTTGRGWGGTTAASHADNAVVMKSHVLANLHDVRMFDGENEIDCWVGSVGSSTKVWIKQSFAPTLTLALDKAIGTGSVTTITIKRTRQNKKTLQRLPSKFLFVIDNEVFFGKDPQPSAYQFTVAARAQKGTVAASHAAGATIRYLDHDLTLAYGNPLAEAPERDDALEPIIDETNSTNTSWIFTDLKSEDNLRSAGWESAIVRRSSPPVDGNSRIYTATENGDADPATDLGFAVKSYYLSGAWRAENFTGYLALYHPAGFTTVTVTGKKRRETANWIDFKMQKSLDGITWTNVFSEATPSTTGSWESLSSHSGVSLGGNYPHVRWLANGSISRNANNAVYLEMAGGTFVINSSNVLQIAFSTGVQNNYYLDATLDIEETGENIRVQGNCKVGSVVVVDCDAETITLDGNEGGISISWNTERDDWLNLPSTKQSVTCTLIYTEEGVTGVDVDVDYKHRMIL